MLQITGMKAVRQGWVEILKGVFLKKGDELQMDRTNGVTDYGKWDELQLWGSKLSLTASNLKIIFKYLTSTMKSKT